MYRLLAVAGGRPVKNEDLELFEQYLSTLEGLYSETGYGDFIVYGCVVTGTPPGATSMTAGVIFYGGVLYAVDAIASNTTIGYAFNPDVTEITPRQLFSGVTANTIELSSMVRAPGGVFLVESADRLGDISTGFIDRGDPATADFTFTAADETVSFEELPLSSIIPTGAKTAYLRIASQLSPTTGYSVTYRMRKKGNSNSKNVASHANKSFDGTATSAYSDFIISLAPDLIVEHSLQFPSTSDGAVEVTVSGWGF